jgi:hypothetical protein
MWEDAAVSENALCFAKLVACFRDFGIVENHLDTGCKRKTNKNNPTICEKNNNKTTTTLHFDDAFPRAASDAAQTASHHKSSQRSSDQRQW